MSPAREALGTDEIHGVVVKSQADAALSSASRVQAVSLLVRAAHPVLLAYATRLFGLATFGAFLASQGAVFVVARVALFGLDRALLVRAPRLTRGEGRVPLGAAMRVVTLTSLVGALAVAVFLLCAVPAASGAFIAVASLSVVPVALLEVVALVAIARGHFTLTTLVRDACAPILAIALVFLPVWPRADALSYALSFAMATLLALVLLGAKLAVDEAVDMRLSAPLPRDVRRTARGSFAADTLQTLAQRVDVLALAIVASSSIVGAYGVIAQFSQTLRALRTGLEPLVQKRVAEGDAREAPHTAETELRAAVRAALGLQIPLAACFVLFRVELLAFFGVHAAHASHALVLLTVGHVASTLLAFEVAVLHARARGLDVAFALAVGATVQALCFFVFVPMLGLVGAALASALGVCVPGVVASLRRRALERRPLRTPKEALT